MLTIFRSFWERARNRRILEIDAFRWRRQLRELSVASDTTSIDKTVWILAPFRKIATIKFESALTRYLLQRGCRVVVILESRDSLAERYYRAAGDVSFRYLDGVDIDGADDFMRRAEKIVDGLENLDEFADLVVEGIPIGRYAASWQLRLQEAAEIDFRDPVQRRQISALVAASLKTIAATRELLRDCAPDFAIANEKAYTPSGEVFALLVERDIPVIQWVGAPRPDSLVFKKYLAHNRDAHPLSLEPASLAGCPELPAEHQTAVREYFQSNYSGKQVFNRQDLHSGKKVLGKQEVLAQLGLDESKKTAVVFSHVLFDATFFYGQTLFGNYVGWLLATARAAAANREMNWIFKVHPANRLKRSLSRDGQASAEFNLIKAELGGIPDNVAILEDDSPINTFSFFDWADIGLTVRGTIGMEFPAFGIPVITAGTGRYAGHGFTIDPVNEDEYMALLAKAHKIGKLDEESINKALLYAYIVFFRRTWKFSTIHYDFGVEKPPVPALGANVYFPAHDQYERQFFGDDFVSLGEWMLLERTMDWLQAEK